MFLVVSVFILLFCFVLDKIFKMKGSKLIYSNFGYLGFDFVVCIVLFLIRFNILRYIFKFRNYLNIK